MLNSSKKWAELTNEFFNSNSYVKLKKRLSARTNLGATVYPREEDLYRAFTYFDPLETKVIILGQDPYYTPNQANGLAFSVNNGIPLTPSLKNIFIELKEDLGIDKLESANGDLSGWASQGVLLMNKTLTVEKGAPNSHSGFGWNKLTDLIISKINDLPGNRVFILWGDKAKSSLDLIDIDKHDVIISSHPSPLSVHKGFFGSRPFSTANKLLEVKGINPIDWSK